MGSIFEQIKHADANVQYAVRLGDDALILGQRLCEWSGQAPTLEEDLALANVALDFLGRTRMFYGYAEQITGCTEDQLASQRDAHEFSNLLLMELPRGDFAFTMARQYLLDVFEQLFFTALTSSTDTQLAAIASKTVKEVSYHARRSEEWMRRLGLGTAESARRLQEGIDEAWGYVDELFHMDELESSLLADGVAPDRQALQAPWRSQVVATLEHAGMQIPSEPWQVNGGRAGVHTEHLGHLLSELQFMQRAYPGLSW